MLRIGSSSGLQDWRKGRRAEVQEVNGWVVDVLKAHGRSAPMNERVVEVAFEIEAGKRQASPDNSDALIEMQKTIMKVQ